MADFGRGIKAGVAAGGVYIVISAILAAIYHNSSSFLYPMYVYAVGLTPFVSSLSEVRLFVLYLLESHIVRGIVFGVVFAALYSFVPGTASVKKGVVLSAFLWIVTIIQIVYTTPGWYTKGIPWIYYGGTLDLSSVGLVLLGIMSALVFGALTGFLWGRFRAKRLAEARKGSPALLVSFILGGLTWTFLAIGFIISVVIDADLVLGSWWLEILFTLVVFLGPFGWVLTLVAWRKTKRGESGFKWGMYGGVIMALTGVMLLPGALAIVGGVLSGRKPADESSTAEIEQ
jgi:hypothetical protein